MLNNIFNIYDPLIFNYPFNWTFLLFNIPTIYISYWIWNNYYYYMKSMLKMKNYLTKNMGFNMLFMNIFMFMLINNLINFLPFNMMMTSHFNFSINISSWMIMSLMMFKININYKIFLMNFSPMNSPMYLLSFINLIEIISYSSRMFTLSIRLMINMMMSHIMMNFINLTMMMLFIIIELIMLIIQSYIFFILLMMYSNEIYYDYK